MAVNNEVFMQNRELSWLRFNDRVLEEALDKQVPLLERLKFISIFSSNLDEFFMIRVGSLMDIHDIDPLGVDNKTGLTASEQLSHIYQAVESLYLKRNEVYKLVKKKLKSEGIVELNYEELEEVEKLFVKQEFKDIILPVLSPQVIDALHPFPHLANNAMYVAAKLKIKDKVTFGLVPVPSSINKIIYFPGKGVRFITAEKIILALLEKIYRKHEISERVIIRTTRNGDINLADEDDSFDMDIDFRLKMKKLLKKRRILRPVRLECSQKVSVDFQKYLCANLNLQKHQVFYTQVPMDMSFGFTLFNKVQKEKRKVLCFKEFKPQMPAEINHDTNMTNLVKKKDILLSYPYESIDPFLKLIKEASYDKSVVAIKITIYRLANKTKLVDYLCTAAENGKDVSVLIELRARFDEQHNIDWSEKLEEAGCTVIYGFEQMKVHSKICLITRKEFNEIKYITQIATGNYNEKTAELYTDLSLMTYNQNIGKDANEFFKNMSIANLDGNYNHLWVAPNAMKSEIFMLIDEQIALKEEGRILIKCNSVTDYNMINKLMEASCAGVQVVMIVRGICCILPDIKNKTENIEIRSIVGRFLEHSRIFRFGKEEQCKMFISSADIMTRNLSKRVEVGCPIYNEDVKHKINELIRVMLQDNIKARKMKSNGSYQKMLVEEECIDSQQVLMDIAINQAVKKKNSRDLIEPKKEKLSKRFMKFFNKK